MTEAYIFDAARTPRGKGRPDGSLHEVTSLALSARLLDAVKERNGLEGHAVEDVIWGNVTQVGEQGGCLARSAVLASGFADDADARVKDWLGGPADVVMSDMAAASSGHKGTDHLRIVALVEAAAEFAFDVLEPGGTFVAKVLAGGAEQGLQAILKRNFTTVANVKPPASRSDSSEKFVVAMGFRGRPDRMSENRADDVEEGRDGGAV